MQKQMKFLKKQNDEYKLQLRNAREVTFYFRNSIHFIFSLYKKDKNVFVLKELLNLKKANDRTSGQYEQLSEEYKPKQELGKSLWYVQGFFSLYLLLRNAIA